MSHHRTYACVLSLLLCSTATAQESAPESARLAPAQELLRDLVVPFHTQPGGGPELWAVAPTYKVRLGDGFTFYPALGADYPKTQWLSWQTESIRVGAEEILSPLASAGAETTGLCAQLRRGPVTEVYDLRPEGLEQSFVLAAPPATPGDLVITGRIATSLTAADQAAGHGPLRFRDAEGRAVLQYGAAWVLDAAGRKAAIPSSLTGDRIRLTVPADWLRNATYPVTVDPLTSIELIDYMSNLGITALDVGHDGRSPTAGTMVALARAISAEDRDIYGFLTDDRFRNPMLVFLTLLPARSDLPRVAFVGGADRWVLVYQQDALPQAPVRTFVHAYVHDRQSPVFNGGGQPVVLASPSGVTQRRPDVGGTAPFSAGTTAFVVWQTDTTTTNQDTSSTEVQGALFDAAQKTFGITLMLADAVVGPFLDRENPTVNQTSAGGADGWCVAWQSRHQLMSGSRIVGNRFRPDGTRAGEADFSSALPGPAHSLFPQLAGSDGRYLLTWLGTSSWTSTTGTQIQTARFDWPAAAPAPGSRGFGVHADMTGLLGSMAEPRLAFDPLTTSHWAISHLRTSLVGSTRLLVSRVGDTGGVVETQTAYDNPSLDATHSALSFARTSGAFLLLGSDHGGAGAAYGWRLEYPPAALASAYGTGCGGTISSAAPHAGNGRFELRLDTDPGTIAALLLLSVGQGSGSLAGAGMPGCWFLLNPTLLVSFTTSTHNGQSRIPLALPDRPPFFGDLYFQWFEVRPGANPAQVLSTRGLKVQVR